MNIPVQNPIKTMSSLEIAELTGKEHKNVMADIRKILEEADISAAEFSAVYNNQQGRETPCFKLPYRETNLVISGYSVKHRLAIMNTITQSTPEFRPNIAVIDGKIKTTSIAIAGHFNKRHERVLNAIRTMECSQEFSRHNFVLAEYIDEQGKPRPSYEITRDGFTFLAMGFTGKQAAQWKEAYINAFNCMENELLSKPGQLPPPHISAEEAELFRKSVWQHCAYQSEKYSQLYRLVRGHYGIKTYLHIPAGKLEEATRLCGMLPKSVSEAIPQSRQVSVPEQLPIAQPEEFTPEVLSAIKRMAQTLTMRQYDHIKGQVQDYARKATLFKKLKALPPPDVGTKHDGDKADWTLLPMGPVATIIRCLEFGAKKYKRDQWMHVPDAERRYQAAAFRHLSAMVDGEWLDSESNLPHAAHVGCCVLFLLWFGNDKVR